LRNRQPHPGLFDENIEPAAIKRFMARRHN
jgi:hypothetical protein